MDDLRKCRCRTRISSKQHSNDKFCYSEDDRRRAQPRSQAILAIRIFGNRWKQKRLTKDEASPMQQFKDSLAYDGERYEVALPWREDCTGLEDNRQQAVSRLVKVEKCFQYDKEKASMYQNTIN